MLKWLDVLEIQYRSQRREIPCSSSSSIWTLPILAYLTFKAPIATKVVCFSCLLKCLRSLYGKQCGPRSDCSGAVCSEFTLFASILNSSVMLGNYLQQTTSADDIFRCIIFLALLGLRPIITDMTTEWKLANFACFVCIFFFRFILI